MAHDNKFVADLAEALLGFSTAHSVGEEWCSFTGTVPVGGVRYAGQMVTRETYADLWAYVQAQGLVKTEAEWQTLSASGDVPYYSDGDGSTTFRMPKKSDSTEGVYAFGEIANSGELDATTLATGLARVEAEVESKLSQNALLVTEKCNQEITINGYNTEYVTISDLTPFKPVYIAAKNVTGKDTIDVIVTSGSVLDAPLSTSMVIQGSQNATIWFPVIPTGTSLEIAVGDNSGSQVKSVIVAYQ